ncbi:camp-specific phosphodiesterase [Aspergillus eucalypticola CBS 122712]|uniref:Camp-specific phosphodiesterase n=1 Tax=Aspergillus eucalypticola (strain CBS 122712 / IBT 29274) TaxID=1448314 RepID=A0A317WIU9_ASPEC|nr:camp-specific phosphodiesterase [Aspergillus eucalypticola CBS 122712]PWY84140.1 camp-specific phosphodiesterase [Aspergillus eucalypticola CBS 122712]
MQESELPFVGANPPEAVGQGDGPGPPSLQIIVLGPTGGPREDRVTGLLVRSTFTKWSANSIVAVDAGTLLCGIIDTLEPCDNNQKSSQQGPFAGLELPHNNVPANAAHVFRHIIGAVCITHPHLDHLSAFAINTPVLEAGSGAKTLAALPSVVAAIKTHVFNDVIWPNLSDEDGGAGLVTYQRLMEGGNPMMGRGDEKGYTRVCEGLLAKCLAISHGCCRQRSSVDNDIQRRMSSAPFGVDPMRLNPRAYSMSFDEPETGYFSGARSPGYRVPGKDGWATVESSAFFIREPTTKREVIIFGDVEPDSISMNPRNRRVWEAAAPKIVASQLRAIFIECSYNDDVDDASLYGHLCPRHLIDELIVLAQKVTELKYPDSFSIRKRKRASAPEAAGDPALSPKSKKAALAGEKSGGGSRRGSARTSRRHTRARVAVEDIDENMEGSPAVSHAPSEVGMDVSLAESSDPLTVLQWPEPPLTGLLVYIIHIKDDMNDGPPPQERILQELKAQGQAAGLGCEFRVPTRGESVLI